MGLLVCAGATLQCSFGVAPSSLLVLPVSKVFGVPPIASIMDSKPMVNILPFGMCNTMSNPVVAASTAAKLGVFTPMPCVPATVAPWVPGKPNILIGNFPALTKESTLMCIWGGVIQILSPSQFKVQA